MDSNLQEAFLRSVSVALLLTTFLALAGCHVNHSENGDKNNVSISTPFGSMKVDTSTGAAATGLTVYPGATPLKDSDDKNNAANVNMSFGDFHLGVKAAGFTTPDAPDKVIAFYKNDMAHFGTVIECQNDKPIGTPTRTSQGLTCDDEHKSDIHTGSVTGHKDEIELRTGSPTSQHIVGLQTKDGSTHIGLVLLNLPPGSSDNAE